MELQTAKYQRIALIKGEARQRIMAVAPEYKQMNAALGLYDAAKTQAIKDAIVAIRTASDAAEAAVNALTTVEAVRGFTW